VIVNKDAIVAETREARQQLHGEFAGDRAALLSYLRSIEGENAERVVTLEPRPAEQPKPHTPEENHEQSIRQHWT
jgi:hypothetical protein